MPLQIRRRMHFHYTQNHILSQCLFRLCFSSSFKRNAFLLNFPMNFIIHSTHIQIKVAVIFNSSFSRDDLFLSFIHLDENFIMKSAFYSRSYYYYYDLMDNYFVIYLAIQINAYRHRNRLNV